MCVRGVIMLEKIYNYANSHDNSSEPRHLTNEERAAALMLLPSYFKDSEEELEKLVTTMTVVPKRFYGSTFFTEKTYTFIKEQFKEFPELLRQIKAEYFSNLLGMNGEVAMKYVEDMDKLRTILAQKTGSKVKLSDFDFKGEYTQEDLKKARWEMDRRENIWDNALDRCMPYRREPNDECLQAEADFNNAQAEYKRIERALEFGELVERTPIKKATTEYVKTTDRTIR